MAPFITYKRARRPIKWVKAYTAVKAAASRLQMRYKCIVITKSPSVTIRGKHSLKHSLKHPLKHSLKQLKRIRSRKISKISQENIAKRVGVTVGGSSESSMDNTGRMADGAKTILRLRKKIRPRYKAIVRLGRIRKARTSYLFVEPTRSRVTLRLRSQLLASSIYLCENKNNNKHISKFPKATKYSLFKAHRSKIVNLYKPGLALKSKLRFSLRYYFRWNRPHLYRNLRTNLHRARRRPSKIYRFKSRKSTSFILKKLQRSTFLKVHTHLLKKNKRNWNLQFISFFSPRALKHRKKNLKYRGVIASKIRHRFPRKQQRAKKKKRININVKSTYLIRKKYNSVLGRRISVFGLKVKSNFQQYCKVSNKYTFSRSSGEKIKSAKLLFWGLNSRQNWLSHPELFKSVVRNKRFHQSQSLGGVGLWASRRKVFASQERRRLKLEATPQVPQVPNFWDRYWGHTPLISTNLKSTKGVNVLANRGLSIVLRNSIRNARCLSEKKINFLLPWGRTFSKPSVLASLFGYVRLRAFYSSRYRRLRFIRLKLSGKTNPKVQFSKSKYFGSLRLALKFHCRKTISFYRTPRLKPNAHFKFNVSQPYQFSLFSVDKNFMFFWLDTFLLKVLSFGTLWYLYSSLSTSQWDLNRTTNPLTVKTPDFLAKIMTTKLYYRSSDFLFEFFTPRNLVSATIDPTGTTESATQVFTDPTDYSVNFWENYYYTVHYAFWTNSYFRVVHFTRQNKFICVDYNRFLSSEEFQSGTHLPNYARQYSYGPSLLAWDPDLASLYGFIIPLYRTFTGNSITSVVPATAPRSTSKLPNNYLWAVWLPSKLCSHHYIWRKRRRRRSNFKFLYLRRSRINSETNTLLRLSRKQLTQYFLVQSKKRVSRRYSYRKIFYRLFKPFNKLSWKLNYNKFYWLHRRSLRKRSKFLSLNRRWRQRRILRRKRFAKYRQVLKKPLFKFYKMFVRNYLFSTKHRYFYKSGYSNWSQFALQSLKFESGKNTTSLFPTNHNRNNQLNRLFDLNFFVNSMNSFSSQLNLSFLSCFLLNPFFKKLIIFSNSLDAKSLTSYYLAIENFLHSRLGLDKTEIKHSNILPNSCFSYTVHKKLVDWAASTHYRWPIAFWCHLTLVRFIEFFTGRKVLFQFYPFMEDEISNRTSARYNLWLPRMGYYERKLGHKFFLKEAVWLMHLAFSLKDITIFAAWLKAMILRISFWRTRSIFRFLKYYFEQYLVRIFPQMKIRGIKIKLKGKISVGGNSRKRTILYRIGLTSRSMVNLKVIHDFRTISTFTGVMGLQIWLFF